MAKLRKAVPVVSVVAMLLLGGSWAAWRVTFGRPAPPPRPAPPGAPGQAVPELVGIEPGAVIEESPPAGWSHRVVRSTMVLDSGDIDSLPDFARKTATMYRTVILADIRPTDGPSPGYSLRRVGVGLALEHGGQERIITVESLDRLGITLSIFDKLVLGRAEAAVARGRLAARTPTFALYDASLELAGGGGPPESAYLRYALLVDPRTGALRTVVWPLAAAPERRTAPDTIILLPPGLEFASKIRVAATRAPGGLPVAWKFALTNLPPGRRLAMPAGLRPWSIRDPADSGDSARMEGLLREALAEEPPAGTAG